MHLGEKDGASKLAATLPSALKPSDVADHYADGQRAWELFGFYFMGLGRLYEAALIFMSLYNQLLEFQLTANRRVHKGVPLFWFAQCHADLGNKVTAKRFFMLTLCEDAIKDRGVIDLDDSGSYFTLVWRLGLADRQLREYVSEVWQFHQKDETATRFPEWCLQQLDQDWMTELPDAQEAGNYVVSTPYVRWLLSRTEDREGKWLELLAQYLIGAMPGCRALRRLTSEVSDYDVVGILEGAFLDFRSEFGRYFLAECKDWATPADFSTVAKLCRVLDSTKCRMGVLFSREGVSGQTETRFAHREIVKVFQDRGIVIVVVDRRDLDKIAGGANFLTMFRSKYEAVRLDLRS
jgi:hypothetical protein